jgi:hypothetical protein
MSASSETIIKLYQQYMPEMIENVIHIYEHYRNLKLPEGCAEYQVNRKKYKDDFWKRVVNEHVQHRYNPEHTISFGRQMCGGQMPWPDLIHKLPGMIAVNERWQNKMGQSSSGFSLGYFDKCNTPQKIDDAIERWNTRNPEVSPADDTSTFCVELVSRNWDFLLNDPYSRNLTALMLLRATEQGGLEKLHEVFGSWLQELADQL